MQNSKRTKYYLLFIAVFIVCSNFFAQTDNKRKIDSLGKLIDKDYVNGNFDKQVILKNATSLYYLSKEIGFAEGQMQSLFEEAKVYFIHGDMDSALLKMNEGIDLAKEKKDYNALCRFLLMYQKLILQLDHLNAAKNILLKAEEYNKLVKPESDQSVNTVFILLSQADLLTVDNKNNNIEKVINLKKQAFEQANKLNDSNKYKKFSVLFSSQSLAISLTLFGKTKDAKKYVEIADKILLHYPSDSFIIVNLMIKGRIANVDKDYKTAVEQFLKAIKLAKKAENKYMLFEIYPMISESYDGLSDYKTAAFYAKSYKHLVDSIDVVKKQIGDVTFVNNINQKILNDKKEKKKENYLLIGGVIAGLLGLGFLLYIRNKKIKMYEEKQAADSVADNNPEKTKELIHLAKEDINVFYTEFQKNYPTFYKNLQETYPELNISDINFCSFIKMNFSIKEISQYTNSSVRAAEARKYRITKKMNLKKQNELYVTLSMIN